MHYRLKSFFSPDLRYLGGYGGYLILDTVLQLWLIYFFLPNDAPPLVDPRLFGAAVLVSRGAEAIASPAVGFFSDRLSQPRLMLLAGTVAFGVGSLGLFLLPQAGQVSFNTLVLFSLLLLAQLGQAAYAVTFLGLLPRIAPAEQQRLRLTNSLALVIQGGVLVGQVLSGIALKALGNNLALMTTIFISGALLLMSLPLSVVAKLDQPEVPVKFSGRELVAILVRNPGFQVIVLAQGLLWLGFNAVRSVVIYLVTVLLDQPAAMVSLYLGFTFLVAILSLVVIRLLADRVSKRLWMMGATAMLAGLMPLLATFGTSVGILNAQNWALLILGLHGIPLAILSDVPNTMVADQIDADYALTGEVKGALFFGVQGLGMKASLGLAGLMQGFLFANFGYSQSQPLGIQLVAIIAGVLALGATVIYSYYPSASRPS